MTLGADPGVCAAQISGYRRHLDVGTASSPDSRSGCPRTMGANCAGWWPCSPRPPRGRPQSEGSLRPKRSSTKVPALFGLVAAAHSQILPTHSSATGLYALGHSSGAIERRGGAKAMDRWFDTKRYRYGDDLIWETWVCAAAAAATLVVGWAMRAP